MPVSQNFLTTLNLEVILLNFLSRGLRSLLIVLIAVLILKAIKKGIRLGLKKLEEEDGGTAPQRRQRAQTLGDILNSTAAFIIGAIAFITLLSEWGVNITPIITGAGIVGLAVGFGAQTLVKDMISGFFILLENQFNKGDLVEVSGVKGKVHCISLRTTTLKDDFGNTHIIPNSKIDKVSKLKPA